MAAKKTVKNGSPIGLPKAEKITTDHLKDHAPMLVEALFRFFSPSPLSLAFNGFLLYESVLFAEFFLGIGLLFLSFLRVRERFSFKRKDSSL